MIVGLWLICFGLQARQFVSMQLETTYQLLQNRCVLPTSDAVFPIENSPLSFCVEYNAEGKIKHLGIAIFSKDEKAAIGEHLCNFHERFLMNTLLEPSDIKAREYLQHHRIDISLSGIGLDKQFRRKDLEQALVQITKNNRRFLALKEDFNWVTNWTDDMFGVSMKFPADIQLILGMDKLEMGLFFRNELQSFTLAQGVHKPKPLLINSNSLKEIRNNMYAVEGESYYIRQMNSNIYVVNDSLSGYSTVFHPKYPEESVANLFVSPDANAEKLRVELHHKIYDTTYVYAKPLYEFLSFLHDDFDTFVGIEHCSKERLDLTVMFRSKNYTYHHLLFVQTTPETLFTAENLLIGTLYAYIPNHNIKDLYYDKWGIK